MIMHISNIGPWLNYLSEIATALGIIAAAGQLKYSRQQSLTTFEDSLAKEYRDLSNRLPTKALLGQKLNDDEYMKAFDELYHYIDLREC